MAAILSRPDPSRTTPFSLDPDLLPLRLAGDAIPTSRTLPIPTRQPPSIDHVGAVAWPSLLLLNLPSTALDQTCPDPPSPRHHLLPFRSHGRPTSTSPLIRSRAFAPSRPHLPSSASDHPDASLPCCTALANREPSLASALHTQPNLPSRTSHRPIELLHPDFRSLTIPTPFSYPPPISLASSPEFPSRAEPSGTEPDRVNSEPSGTEPSRVVAVS